MKTTSNRPTRSKVNVLLVVQLDVCHSGDDIFEVTFSPGFSRMLHHGQYGVVVLFVLVVKEDELGPKMCLRIIMSNRTSRFSFHQRFHQRFHQFQPVDGPPPCLQRTCSAARRTLGILTRDQKSSRCSRIFSGLYLE